MKIYTRAGDGGKTALQGGLKALKSELRVCAYGEVDELNSFLGWAASQLPKDGDFREIGSLLGNIQNRLFEIGSCLSNPRSKEDPLPEEAATELEKAIDRRWEALPPLRNFVLPGGSQPACALHVARAACRRAERAAVALAQQEEVPHSVLVYLNRLSDLLFALARWTNWKLNSPEFLWQKKKG